MKAKITIILPLLFSLTACATASKPSKQLACNNCTTVSYLASKHFPVSNPALVNTYGSKPQEAYVQIAKISVNHLNSSGTKRSQGELSDIMKNDAAMLGGNGLINIQAGKRADSATVIHLARGRTLEPSYMPI